MPCGGHDTFGVKVRGAASIRAFLASPRALRAIRRFNLTHMNRGRNAYQASHCYSLADHMLGGVSRCNPAKAGAQPGSVRSLDARLVLTGLPLQLQSGSGPLAHDRPSAWAILKSFQLPWSASRTLSGCAASPPGSAPR